jgi:hypothetical protein
VQKRWHKGDVAEISLGDALLKMLQDGVIGDEDDNLVSAWFLAAANTQKLDSPLGRHSLRVDDVFIVSVSAKTKSLMVLTFLQSNLWMLARVLWRERENINTWMGGESVLMKRICCCAAVPPTC